MAIYVDGKKVAGFGGRQGPPGIQGLPGADGKDGAPGAKGDPGETPYIGTNGNWWIGETDTGVSASGGSTAGVESFNGRTGVVMPKKGDYTAADVGALPASTSIPANTSDLNNDSGFVTTEDMTAAIQAAVLDSWEGSY